MDGGAKRRVGGSQAVPILSLLVSMLSFTAGASFAKRLFPAVGAEGATTLRLAGGAIMLMLLMRPWRARPRVTAMRSVVVYGLAMAGMNLLFYMALSRIPLGIAVALEFAGPLAVTILSSRSAVDFLWASLACAGVVLILPKGGPLAGVDAGGAAMALAAGACWAVYIVAGKRAGERHGAAATALGMGLGALVVVPIGFAHAGAALLRPDILLSGVAVAFLSSALPYTLEMIALRRLRTKAYATLTSCEPAIGALSGLVFLHETLARPQIVAIALIIAAAIGAASTSMRGQGETPPA